MGIRKKFYAISVVRHWNMPRGMMDASSLETSKIGLDRAPSNLIEL